MKISIIGISGSGKSTLARKLQEKLGIEAVYADTYIWGANWVLQDRDVASQQMLSVLTKKENWVFDGYISYVAEYILTESDVVIYLDYSGLSALFGVLKRWWTHRKIPRPEFAEGCEESLQWKYFFYVVLFRKERAKIEMYLKQFPPKKLYRITSRKKLHTFLSSENIGASTAHD